MNISQRLEPNPTWNEIRKSLEKRIKKKDGCWNWHGPLTPQGYGRLWGRPAHRLSYEAWIGPIGYGLDVDHLCRNRKCVNPEHLEPVTRKVNLSRGVGIKQQKEKALSKTHCSKGHEFTEKNIYIRPSDGARQCRKCRSKASRQYGLSNKDAINARKRRWRKQWKMKGIRK